MHSDASDGFFAAFCCVLAAVLISVAPVGAALLARVRRDAKGRRPLWVRVLGFVLVWQAFNLSMLAIWGVTVARDRELVSALLVALVLMQPVALVLAFRAIAEGGSNADR